MNVNASSETKIYYNFSGSDKNTAGYAEGTVKLTVESAGDYKLYWADSSGVLKDYSPIASWENLSAGASKTVSFSNHTVIPKGAERIIALNKSGSQVSEYVLPESKRLNAGKLLYTFNSYSDIHIDKETPKPYYTKASKRWADALKYGVKMNTDFIVTSGDSVTNAAGPDAEWEEYEKLLSESDYVNPVWESDGNHEMRFKEESGLKAFIRASGTDSTAANYDANKPYYYMVEKNSGDIFIFMALEKKGNAGENDEFSTAQMNWVENLLKNNYDKGVNIYIVEHAPINGFGAGDRMSKPFYNAHLNENYNSTVRFKNLLKKYPKLIWMSGHTHLDLTEGYNYSNENNTACHMIHNPAVAGTTKGDTQSNDLIYKNKEGEVGFNSQGYYVEVYENEVIYYGADLLNQTIYPQYSYIMEGVRAKSPEEQPETTVEESSQTPSETESTEPESSESGTPTNTTEVETTIESVTSSPENTTEAPETTKPTEEEKFEIGDVNMDKNISVKDASLIQKAIARITKLSDKQNILADTDFNNEVNIKDATRIQKFVAKLLDSFYSDTQKSSKLLSGAGSFTEELTKAKQTLASYYSFSSYDQYQALKKLYYEYKNKTSADNESEVITDFEAKIKSLTDIAKHIGVTEIYSIGDTYYFENTNNWNEVYAYAWTGSSHNAEWPGAKLSKVGTNAGHDVYKIKFDSPAQYSSIIFNGGKDKPQTVDISLEKYKGNCFYLNGKTTDGKLNVGDFSYNSGTDPTSTSPSSENFAIYYYTENHAWGYDSGKLFTANGDGTYSFDYTAADSSNLSFCIYNTKTKAYNCVSESQSFTYSADIEKEYILTQSSSRGKSITVKELSQGIVLKLTYNPTSNSIKILCK